MHPKDLLQADRLKRVSFGAGDIWTNFLDEDASGGGPFEGIYGRVYDRVIRNPRLRRAVFEAWGFADPLLDLEGFVDDAVAAALRSPRPEPVLADVPCGGGVLLPLFARGGFRGYALEIDIAQQMLRRALIVARQEKLPFETIFLRGDALALPVHEGVVDVTVSLNGLHVVADHERFLAELARITRSGGTVWVITPITNRESRRSRLILAAADRIGVTPQTPPTGDELRALALNASLTELRSYGGESITGRVYQRL